MQSKEKFYQSISEVDVLNSQAKIESNNITSRESVYYKAIILLLCAKLEMYVKESTKEYYMNLLSHKLSADKMPKKFIIEILKNEIQYILDKSCEKYKDKEKTLLKKNLSLFWEDKYVVEELRDDFSISISNNGTTAFEAVYKKIGLENIITELAEYEESVTDEFGIDNKVSIQIVDTINKVIHMRHNIIHDDKTPQITEEEIEKYIKVFKSFVDQIDSRLEEEIEKYIS